MNINISSSGKTCRHFKTGIEKHIKKDNKSHIFKHLYSSKATFFDSSDSLCFKIIDGLTLNSAWKLGKLYMLTGERLT